MTQLIEAAAAGSVHDMRQLLAGGGDVNCAGTNGNTALHEAVNNGHARVAALLLQAGADWTLRNDEGHAALNRAFADLPTLHRIRQEYQRLPAPAHLDAMAPNPEVASHVSQLRRDGILKVSGLVSGEQLAQMQADFARLIRRLKLGRFLRRKNFSHYDQEEYWHAKHRSYVTNDALASSPGLLSLCMNRIVIETAKRYLRKTGNIKRTYGMRYLPSGPIETHQFGWHHDMEDRQLKVMVILTDVGEADQYMSYVRGSHNAFHPYTRFLKNSLDFDYCRSYLDEIDLAKTTGHAGDLFFFDSNGMHRGVRSFGRVRDALFIEFTGDKNPNNLWGTVLSRDRIPASLDGTDHPLKHMLSIVPKWKRSRNGKPRKLPSWAESLGDLSTWV